MHPGEIYHIYNHANGHENLFLEEKNYNFFLAKLSIYILPVCEVYAYCLMPNHFHLVAGVKDEEQLQKIFKKQEQVQPYAQKELELKVSKSFSNLFSSYTQAFNKEYKRMGSLLMPSMKWQLIETDSSFCKVVHYTHANPVHHGFARKIDEWPHSSYLPLLSTLPTKLKRGYVLELFGGIEPFKEYHKQAIDVKTKWMDE
jgi:REP element-mobilizing transposase RayT